MNQTELDLLVAKRLTNQISGNEQAMLDQYLVENEGADQIYKNSVAIWDAVAAVPDNISFDSSAAFKKFQNKIKEQSQNNILENPTRSDENENAKVVPMRRFLKIAMAVAAVFAGGLLIPRFFQSDLTTVGGDSFAQTYILPDQSEIEITPNSKIVFNKSSFTNERRIQLNGTATFKVAKNGAKFIVEGKDFNVEVLGTTFKVESTDGSRKVSVIEGKVAVRNHKNQQVVLKANEVINDVENNIEEIAPLTNISQGYNPELIYVNEKISKVFADLENKFGIVINFNQSQQAVECTFSSASLKENSLEQIINLIEAAFATKFVKISEKEYSVKRLNCK